MLCLKVWYILWSFIVAKWNKLLKQSMRIQNLSEPVFFITSGSATIKLLHFKWTMVRHNEHSIKFLQLTNFYNWLIKFLQISIACVTNNFAFIRPNKSIKKEKNNVTTKLMKALLSHNPLIGDAITFNKRETVRFSKCLKLNSFLFFLFFFF